MKYLLILSFIFPFIAFADHKYCSSQDETVKIIVNSNAHKVISVNILKNIDLEIISEQLPNGVYLHYEDLNENLNWYFQERAWLEVSGIVDDGKQRLVIYGQDDSAPRVIVFAKDLICSQN